MGAGANQKIGVGALNSCPAADVVELSNFWGQA